MAQNAQRSDIPELLLDLARDRALTHPDEQTAADVLYIRTMLHAAVRLSPDLDMANIWLYELNQLAQQPESAAEVLARFIQHHPHHTLAFREWLTLGARSAQTIEQRRAWLEGLLTNGPPPPLHQALIHTQLARLAAERGDRASAEQYLRRAFAVYPYCPDAAMLALELLPRGASARTRLLALLPVLQVNPSRADVAWNVALVLDECGHADRALPFYEHAVSVREATGTETELVPEDLMHLSQNALGRGALQVALAYARRATVAADKDYAPAMYYCWLLKHAGEDEHALNLRRSLSRLFERTVDAGESPVQTVAQAAWFYTILDRQPHHAVVLAESAARNAPGDPFAERVLGWSYAAVNRTDDAIRVLTPLAKQDPYAAYQLAQLLRRKGQRTAAQAVISELVYVPSVGPAREMLDRLAGAGGIEVMRKPPAGIEETLARFDETVLQLHKDPAHFITADIRIEAETLAFGAPWRAVLSLTNESSFPVTCGPEWMLNPVFLISFELQADRTWRFEHLLSLGLDNVYVLEPGKTVSLRRTLDVGPPLAISRRRPLQDLTVRVSAILDPMKTEDGKWKPRLNGQQVRTVSFVRKAAATDPASWQTRLAAAQSAESTRQQTTLEALGALLGEFQRASGKARRRLAAEIPAKKVHEALLAALGSPRWEVRVRALNALHAAGLDRKLLEAAQQCLGHGEWPVRLMTVRLLARQGAAFEETAARIARNDTDLLVRSLAQSYLDRWAQSRPETAVGNPDASGDSK